MSESPGAMGVRRVHHIKLFHPANDHYGLSLLEAAAQAIDLHNTAARWNVVPEARFARRAAG